MAAPSRMVEAKTSGVVCEDLDHFPVEGVRVHESDHKVAMAGAFCVLVLASLPLE